MIEALKSAELKRFLKSSGIKISKNSSYNMIELINEQGDKVSLWAESIFTVADGIPGLYVDEPDDTGLKKRTS